jgi:beta-galactosidase
MKTPGVGDIFRNGKPGATFYRSQVDVAKRAVVEPAFGWDGAAVPGAMVCTNCERLEIYLGDEHVATTSPDTRRFGNLRHPPHFLDLPDAPAELRIEGYVDGECVVSRHMAADRAGDRFVLDADDTTLVADGVDTTRVVFRIVDRYGNRRSGTAGTVHFSLDGPATLIGENPFDLTDTPGGAAVWLKSRPGIGGAITLTAGHSTMGTATVTVDAAHSPRGSHEQ